MKYALAFGKMQDGGLAKLPRKFAPSECYFVLSVAYILCMLALDSLQASVSWFHPEVIEHVGVSHRGTEIRPQNLKFGAT